MSAMTPKLRALAGVNVAGWLVGVPMVVTAMVSPFVDFTDWPRNALAELTDGHIQLGGPELERTMPTRSADAAHLRVALVRGTLENADSPAARAAVAVGEGTTLRIALPPAATGQRPLGAGEAAPRSAAPRSGERRAATRREQSSSRALVRSVPGVPATAPAAPGANTTPVYTAPAATPQQSAPAAAPVQDKPAAAEKPHDKPAKEQQEKAPQGSGQPAPSDTSARPSAEPTPDGPGNSDGKGNGAAHANDKGDKAGKDEQAPRAEPAPTAEPTPTATPDHHERGNGKGDKSDKGAKGDKSDKSDKPGKGRP